MSNSRAIPEPATQQLKLILVDDHPILRAGLKALLATQSDFSVVAEADTGALAVELAERLNPDLILMDVSLPGMSGSEATRLVKRAKPKLPVLALSVHEEVTFVRMLLDAGANGYALKRSACDELVRAVRTVAAGGSYVDPAVSAQLLRSGARSNPGSSPPVASLSEREAEVVRLLAQGMTMKEVAQQLTLSPRTLETYRARAMEKLDLKTRADLVRYAFRSGWLEP
ncbi:MAG TPA: response regulator transcription factor [Polyangiaceae bacterium]|nr:response regulator transcription factor [Polyangiaceae bacterium]